MFKSRYYLSIANNSFHQFRHIFHLSNINNSKDLHEIYKQIENRANSRIDDIITSNHSPKNFLSRMDDLSDEMCLLLDLCQLLQHYHPLMSMKRQAFKSFLKMTQFIQQKVYNNKSLYLLLQNAQKELQDKEFLIVSQVLLDGFKSNSNILQPKTSKLISHINNQVQFLDDNYCYNKNTGDNMFKDPLFIDLISSRQQLAKLLNYHSFPELVFNQQRHIFNSLDDIKTFLKKNQIKLEKSVQLELQNHKNNSINYYDEYSGLYILKRFCQEVLGYLLDINSDIDPHVILGLHISINKPPKMHKLTLNTFNKEILGTIFLWITDNCSTGATFPLCSYSSSNRDCLLRNDNNPVVVILCPSFFNNHESLRILFHEFGHALHHVLWNRSPFQLLSGNRHTCIELMELPSTWTEKKISQSYNIPLGNSTIFPALNRYINNAHAVLDLNVYDLDTLDIGYAIDSLKNKYCSILSSKESSLYHHFIHNPASYYMYSIADHIVDNILDDDPEMIQKYMNPFEPIPLFIKKLLNQ